MENIIEKDITRPNEFITTKRFFVTHRSINHGDEGKIYVCIYDGRQYALKRFYSETGIIPKRITEHKIEKINAIQKIPRHDGLVNILGAVRLEGKRSYLGYLMDYIRPSTLPTLAVLAQKDSLFLEGCVQLYD